jgi:hypothetical protein
VIAMNNTPNGDESPGGRGEGVYLTPVQENKIVRMVLNRKRRFKVTPAIKREMLETSRRNMQDEDGRVSNSAVSNLIKMESLNQADEHHAEGETVNHVHSVDERRAKFLGIAERIGIAGMVIDAATSKPGSDPAAIVGIPATTVTHNPNATPG